MNFRPCIDLHNGKVKQIVGASLDDAGQGTVENFVSTHGADYYAHMFKEDQLRGGHVIMLGGGNEEQAVLALNTYPGGLQIGGGITADNATYYLDQGASHVIVTSYIFQDGQLHMDNLEQIVAACGRERLVIDLSCKQKNGSWYVMTNRWQQYSEFELNQHNIRFLEQYCAEFLIHAVDVEGKQSGMQQDLVQLLAAAVSIPTTYAGGIRSVADLQLFERLTDRNLDVTIGSALDIFGGKLPYREVLHYFKQLNG